MSAPWLSHKGLSTLGPLQGTSLEGRVLKGPEQLDPCHVGWKTSQRIGLPLESSLVRRAFAVHRCT